MPQWAAMATGSQPIQPLNAHYKHNRRSRTMQTLRIAASASLVAAALAAVAAAVLYKRQSQHNRRERLRRALHAAFESIATCPEWQSADGPACVLLSGGVDSAIVAEVGGKVLDLQAAFTVICSDDATDMPHAEASASAAGLQHTVVRLTLPELLRRHLPAVVRTTCSFDPMTLRNDVAIAAALSEAASRGFRRAVTGDGADELLGGYSFTHRLAPKEWAAQRAHMASVMRFGSVPIGRQYGVYVTSPYTQKGVRTAALALGKEECVRGDPPASTGKVVLRELFPEVTSAGRRKDPIEVGCGTTALSRPGYWDEQISDEQYTAEVSYVREQHGVELRDKEHLAYYRVFRETFPNGEVPGKPRNGSDPCPKCRYQLSQPTQTFCVTCGHYDPQLRFRHAKAPAAS